MYICVYMYVYIYIYNIYIYIYIYIYIFLDTIYEHPQNFFQHYSNEYSL